jgi:hypothetical protein
MELFKQHGNETVFDLISNTTNLGGALASTAVAIRSAKRSRRPSLGS